MIQHDHSKGDKSIVNDDTRILQFLTTTIKNINFTELVKDIVVNSPIYILSKRCGYLFLEESLYTCFVFFIKSFTVNYSFYEKEGILQIDGTYWRLRFINTQTDGLKGLVHFYRNITWIRNVNSEKNEVIHSGLILCSINWDKKQQSYIKISIIPVSIIHSKKQTVLFIPRKRSIVFHPIQISQIIRDLPENLSSIILLSNQHHNEFILNKVCTSLSVLELEDKRVAKQK